MGDALTQLHPMDAQVLHAAERLFGQTVPRGAELAELARQAGFDQALPALDANDAWPVAAAVLYAQALHGAPIDLSEAMLRGAADGAQRDAALILMRCIAMTGAMRAALELSVRYVGQRKQFGRPLAAFQAIQHTLAVAAEYGAGALVATESALAAVAVDGLNAPRCAALIDSALLTCCDAVTRVIDAAHQVHGAMGFTQEYPLHRHTLNLLRWRDQATQAAGGEIACAERLGRLVAEHGGLWRAVTATDA